MTFIVEIILIMSSFFILQSIFSLFWMIYAWEDPEYVKSFRSPQTFSKPSTSFTAIIPARFEEKVITDTLLAISNIDYPEDLKEVIVVCRTDDVKTIKKIEKLLSHRMIKQKNIRLITFDGLPINKPHSLNIGLSHATKNVVVVFDAEDQPHKDIYSIANTIFNKKDISILQSGVQLINYSSRWFSVFNVLEYYFWFKSGLHFFTKIGKITPLAGNTIFFDKQILTKIGGWDENCLTEDAEIAFRLIPNGGKIGIVYDERHVTFEETPIRLKDFIKQRTRWNQGFFQVFSRMDWIRLPKLRQKILSVYILLSPLTQLIVLLYLPFTIWALFFYKIPVLISLYSFLPMYLFLLQIALYIIGFIEFNFAYKLHAPFFTYLIIVIMFFPYQLILTISAIRACYRVISNQYQWEKTKHANIHRSISFDSSTSYA